MLNLLDLIKPVNENIPNSDELNISKYQVQSNQKIKQKTNILLKVDDPARKSFISTAFKNSSMIKEDFLVSKFYQVIAGVQNKFVPEIKIQPTLLINKIQQPRLYLKSNIICKQLAYDILLQDSQSPKTQITKNYKVKNCISPARPNSQIYKRLSKDFFENIKNGVNQCLLFTGLQNQARLQSSIGNQKNPGIFMIVAIAVLDQKYKENHERFDVQFSFLEYKNEKVYDLINYTQISLEPKQRDHKNSRNQFEMQFCQHSVKVNTFLQFIKLFKIALFNNKQRDFKTNKNQSNDQGFYGQSKNSQSSSTFIMKIKIKKFNIQNQLIYEQQTLLIDLNEKLSNKNSQVKEQISVKSDKILGQKRQKGQQNASRQLIDYILIEMNNSNPNNKPIHYHMVQKNLLLQILKKYLRRTQKQNVDQLLIQPYETKSQNKRTNINIANKYSKQQTNEYFLGGQLFIINTFTTSSINYCQNTKFYQSIISALGDDWKANFRHRHKSNCFFDINFAQKVLQKVIYAIQNRNYTSLRDLFTVKEFYVRQSKKLIQFMKSYKAIITEYINLKKQLRYSQNVFAAYEFQLIGNCIKSDNFKDFYTSKSFLALARQLQIKTENVKSDIINYISGLKQVQEKFQLVRKKQIEERKLSVNPPNCLLNTVKQKTQDRQSHNKFERKSSNNKFKLLQNTNQSSLFCQFNDLQEFLALRKYISDYFQQIWYKIYLTDERTITQSILFQDSFVQQIELLKQKITVFFTKVDIIDESTIKCLKDGNLLSLNNFTQLVRSINQAKKSILKHQPQHSGKSPFSLRNQFMKNQSLKIQYKNKNQFVPVKTTTHLPKIQQNQIIEKNSKQKSHSTNQLKQNKYTIRDQSKFNRFKSFGRKQSKNIVVFDIQGRVNFQGLILNPNRI